MSKLRTGFFRHWFAMEAVPLYVIIGGALVGATWYTGRLATRPDVIWTKSNPTPWNTVKQDENIKLMTGDHKFDKNWSRGKL